MGAGREGAEECVNGVGVREGEREGAREGRVLPLTLWSCSGGMTCQHNEVGLAGSRSELLVLIFFILVAVAVAVAVVVVVVVVVVVEVRGVGIRVARAGVANNRQYETPNYY